MKYALLFVTAISLSACSTLNFNKDRAAENRKQELCRDIATKDQPQCTGNYVPPTPTS